VALESESGVTNESNQAKELEEAIKRWQSENRRLHETLVSIEGGSALISQINQKLIPQSDEETA
jgi:hypothetical protein